MLDVLQSAGAMNPVLNGPIYRGSRFDDVDVADMAAGIELGRLLYTFDRGGSGGESSLSFSPLIFSPIVWVKPAPTKVGK